MSRYSAGVLLYSYDYDGKLIFLLGKDYRHRFSDFGGRADVTDATQIDTATREFYEETCGIVLDVWVARNAITKAPIIHSLSYMGDPYYMYMIHIPYSKEYVESFDMVRRFIHLKKVEKRFKEKLSLRWFTSEEIMTQKNDIRQVFYKTFSKNLDIIHQVTSRKVFKH